MQNELEKLSEAELMEKLCKIIEYMKGLRMDVTTFLYYFSWYVKPPEDMRHEANKIRYVLLPSQFVYILVTEILRYARSALMHSVQLPQILQKWHKPPCSHNSGIKTRAGRRTLTQWAVSNVTARIQREMRLYAPSLKSPPSTVSEDELLAIDLVDDVSEMREKQPVFWKIMSSLANAPKQQKNKYKNNDPVSRAHSHGNISLIYV